MIRQFPTHGYGIPYGLIRSGCTPGGRTQFQPNLAKDSASFVPAQGRGQPRTWRAYSWLPRIILTLGLLTVLRVSATETAENTTKHSTVMSSKVEPVIAGYLINFLRYVEWPEAVPPVGEPWRVGLLNAEGLRPSLARMISGKMMRGHPIEIISTSDPADLRDCQLVMLGDVPPENASSVAKVFAGRPVLTVVYQEKEIATEGAIIELVLQGRSIRYRLNTVQLTVQGLKPTPGLLENALPPVPPMAQSS